MPRPSLFSLIVLIGCLKDGRDLRMAFRFSQSIN
jgi:hypothetical protein